jgi:hypothetical protein
MFEWSSNRLQHLKFINEVMQLVPPGLRCFHVHGSFGDVYFQLSALKEVAGQGESFVIAIDSKYDTLVILAFENTPIKVVFVSSVALNYALNSVGVFGVGSGFPVRLLPTVYPMIPEAMLNGLLGYIKFLRLLVGSKSTGSMTSLEVNKHFWEQSELEIRTAGLVAGKTVIICADNNTQCELNDRSWESVISVIQRKGWHVVLNDSGNLSTTGALKLNYLTLPRIKVKPHLVVALTSILGGYVCGTNGFATIQAFFNKNVKGTHFINGDAVVDGMIVDKFDCKYPVEMAFHQKSNPDEFLNLQEELIYDSSWNADYLYS